MCLLKYSLEIYFFHFTSLCQRVFSYNSPWKYQVNELTCYSVIYVFKFMYFQQLSKCFVRKIQKSGAIVCYVELLLFSSLENKCDYSDYIFRPNYTSISYILINENAIHKLTLNYRTCMSNKLLQMQDRVVKTKQCSLTSFRAINDERPNFSLIGQTSQPKCSH